MWPNPQETADLVTFTDEILYEKLYFNVVLVKTFLKFIINDHNNIYLAIAVEQEKMSWNNHSWYLS